MPIRKFRSVEEMEGNVRYEPGSPELFRAIRSLWAFSARTFPRRFPPGVYKHRSIEDAQRRATLLARPESEGRWRLDIRLQRGVQGETETVFLDI